MAILAQETEVIERRMDTAAWLSVKLYMQTQIITRFIRNPYGQRLLDLLNRIVVGRVEQRGRFLEPSEVTIHLADGKGESLATAYIYKGIVELATAPDVDLSKGMGGKVGPKSYPSQEKYEMVIESLSRVTI